MILYIKGHRHWDYAHWNLHYLFLLGADVDNAFLAQRLYEPSGPLVNSEFYTGWITHWGEIFQRVATDAVVNTLDEMLARNASVNFFMFYGGTNFGFSAGEIIRTDVGALKKLKATFSPLLKLSLGA